MLDRDRRDGHHQGMSWVTNVLLSVDYEDETEARRFSDWLASSAPMKPGSRRTGSSAVARGVGSLRDITTGAADTRTYRTWFPRTIRETTSVWGGPKYPECCVWAGTLNHADVSAVIAQAAQWPWHVPAAMQLLIMDQEQTAFQLWMLRDGHMRQYAPTPPDDDATS